MPRPRVPLTFGAGLDRATGSAAKDPRTFYDARNVIAREAGMELRTGLSGTGLPALDWGTDVIAMESVQKTLDVLQVVYDRVSRDVRIYRLNPVSTPTRQLVGTWGTLNASAAFPIVTMAEAGGVVFFAHAEEVLAYRLPTKYWTPGALDTDAGTLTTANADFDGSGSPGDIYFYGVCAYREYIVGWGWGTETDNTTKDRPEIVRLSKPDNPTVFPAENYFLCGTRSTRVVGCTPMPGGLLVGSRTQRYTIFGTDPETFGVELTDPSHGIVSPRAWKTINGVAYTWSQTGPRETADPMAPSRDLALPLDLMQAVPSGWPTRGPAREAFAGYDPEQRVLYWAWPDLTATSAPQTMTYACSLRSPNEPRFTVAVFERRLACAGTYLSGKVAPAPGTGYASAVGLTDGGWISGENGRRVTVSWTNNSVLGNESVEVWLKAGSGAWALRSTVALSGTTQSTQLIGLEALEAYEVALRHLAPGPTYTSGYTQATPDLWTAGTAAGSKGTITTGGAAPVLVSGAWARTSATTSRIALDGTTVDRRCVVEFQKNAGAGWVPAGTLDMAAVPSHPFAQNVEVLGAELGVSMQYRCRLTRGVTTSAWSNTLTVLAGIATLPPAFAHWFDLSAGSTQRVELWTAANALAGLTLQYQHVASAAVLVPTGGHTFERSAVRLERASAVAEAFDVRARVAVTSFGVTDYGPWGTTVNASVNPAGSDPAVPTTARFLTPHGTFERPPSGLDRYYPQYCTPNQLTSSVHLFFATELVYTTDAYAIATEAINNTLAEITFGGGGRFAVAQAFHFNPSTRRRSAWSDGLY